MCLGNLAADAELRSTQGGQAVLNFAVACSDSYLDKNQQRQEKVEYIKCVLWGKRAEALSQYMSKGTKVYVEGSLHNSSYEDKDGNKRYKTDVNVREVILCGGRGRASDDSEGGGGGERKPPARQKPKDDFEQEPDFGGGGDDSFPF